MENSLLQRKRDLLPLWMKIFIWLFLIIGTFAIITRILSIFGIDYWINTNGEKTIYGMETTENYSILSIFISSLIIYKGVVAFGMWTEKKWAINAGIIDAGVGIVICIIMMFIEPIFLKGEKYNINFRFELIFLLPYLIKCMKIKEKWSDYSLIYKQKNISKNPSSNQSANFSDKNQEDIIDYKVPNKNTESDEDYLKKYMPK